MADITTGLVAKYACQDNAASTTVVAATGSNAALVGAGNTSASSFPGPGGLYPLALRLDGIAGAITGTLTAAGTGAFTIAAYMKAAETTINAYAFDMRATLAASASRTILRGFQDAFYNCYNGAAYPIGGVATNSQMPATTSWQHVCYTWDATTLKGYIDGVQIITGAGSFTAEEPAIFAVGAADLTPLAAFSAMDVAAVHIYSRALAAADVSALVAQISTTTDRISSLDPTAWPELYD